MSELSIKEALQQKYPITTSCKNCVFAIYDGKTQTGCEFDRINKFKATGTDIIEAYDDEKEFYVIDGRRCLACKDHNWAKANPGNHKKIVRKEVQLRCESFVYIDKNDDISKICTTVNGLLGQVLRPTVITLTRHPESSLHISKLVRWFRNYMDNKNIEWRVEAIPAQTSIRATTS